MSLALNDGHRFWNVHHNGEEPTHYRIITISCVFLGTQFSDSLDPFSLRVSSEADGWKKLFYS